MTRNNRSILFIGYGNILMTDDGLGPALAGCVKRWKYHGTRVIRERLLLPEHAEAAARHSVTILADSDISAFPPFCFRRVKESPYHAFNPHGISPESLIGCARELFDAVPIVFLLGIRGYGFAVGDRLTEPAERNLRLAKLFIRRFLNGLKNGNWPDFCEI